MKPRHRPAARAGTLIRSLAIAGVAALFAFLAMVSASLSLAERKVFAPALLLAPRASPVIIPLAVQRLGSSDAAAGLLVGELRRALATDPLDYRAVLALGAAAEKQGDARLGLALANQALVYNPRSRQIRSWLLERDLRRGDVTSSIAHIDRLLVLAPELRPQTLAALALLAQEPATHTPILAMLAPRPDWFPNFFDALYAQQVDPSLMRKLIEPIATAGPHAQRLYIGRLVDAGRLQEARSVWLGLLPPQQRQSEHVYDGTFLQKAGLAPFAWRYPGQDHASTELVPGGGMRAFYLSNAPAQFAEQMLVLPPGRYRLQLSAHVRPDVPASKLSWRLRCTGGADLAALTLPLSPALQELRADFRIGDGACATQLLSLEGTPGDGVQSSNAETRRIAIEELG